MIGPARLLGECSFHVVRKACRLQLAEAILSRRVKPARLGLTSICCPEKAPAPRAQCASVNARELSCGPELRKANKEAEHLRQGGSSCICAKLPAPNLLRYASWHRNVTRTRFISRLILQFSWHAAERSRDCPLRRLCEVLRDDSRDARLETVVSCSPATIIRGRCSSSCSC